MRNCRNRVPVRLRARAGALLFPLLLTGCDRAGETDEGPRVLELLNDTVELAQGVRVHDVAVSRTASGDFDPQAPSAQTGDVVRFISQDAGNHAIAFEGSALSDTARAFLDTTGQLRSPPLITAGSTWIISLDGAPPGVYTFRCATHGSQGQLTVAVR